MTFVAVADLQFMIGCITPVKATTLSTEVE